MMNEFLANNRDALITRCTEKVAKRPQRAATEQQLKNGIPMFIDQLTRTLEAEQSNEDATSLRISGLSGGDTSKLSEMGLTAAAHGKELLHLGYSVDQVVDYMATSARLSRTWPSSGMRLSASTNTEP